MTREKFIEFNKKISKYLKVRMICMDSVYNHFEKDIIELKNIKYTIEDLVDLDYIWKASKHYLRKVLIINYGYNKAKKYLLNYIYFKKNFKEKIKEYIENISFPSIEPITKSVDSLFYLEPIYTSDTDKKYIFKKEI